MQNSPEYKEQEYNTEEYAAEGYDAEEFHLEAENRIRNLMWTVSGDYTLDVKPDLSAFRKSKYIALYDAVKQGAFSRFFDQEALSMYIVKKVYLSANNKQLMTLSQLCVDAAIYRKISRSYLMTVTICLSAGLFMNFAAKAGQTMRMEDCLSFRRMIRHTVLLRTMIRDMSVIRLKNRRSVIVPYAAPIILKIRSCFKKQRKDI